MNYFFGFILVSIEKIIISVANIYDGELSRRTFKSVWTIVFLNGVLTILIVPIIFFFLHPRLISVDLSFIILIVAFIEFIYQIPYYKALQYNDTSAVSSLFSIGKIFVPIFAYFIAHELLAPIQYLGFFIIILASVALSFDRRSLGLNKSFYYMVPVTLLLAIQSAFQKEGLNHIDWETFYFWELLFSGVFSLITILLPKVRMEVRTYLISPFQKGYLPLYGQNIASWIANGLDTLAVSLLPVTIIKAFGSFHSLIVHIISSKAGNKLHIQAEIFSWKKALLFVLVAIGVLLTLNIW